MMGRICEAERESPSTPLRQAPEREKERLLSVALRYENLNSL